MPVLGTSETGMVMRIDGSNDGHSHPADDQSIRITITLAN